MKKLLFRYSFVPILGLLSLVLLACTPALEQTKNEPAVVGAGGSSGDAPLSTDIPSNELVDLKSVQAFQSIFNQDAGQPRLILLLSPT